MAPRAELRYAFEEYAAGDPIDDEIEVQHFGESQSTMRV
jgi:hypothetical protein